MLSKPIDVLIEKINKSSVQNRLTIKINKLNQVVIYADFSELDKPLLRPLAEQFFLTQNQHIYYMLDNFSKAIYESVKENFPHLKAELFALNKK